MTRLNVAVDTMTLGSQRQQAVLILDVPHLSRTQSVHHRRFTQQIYWVVKGKGSPYLITERRVPEMIPVLGSQPAGDVSHKPGGRLPLLSARPAVTPTTLKRAATNFAAW